MSNRLFLGTAVTQQTGFPEFKDADVHIVISGSRQYQLHSSILKNGSPTMRALLDDTKVAKLSSKAIKDGIHIRFRLQLVPDEKEEGKYVLDKVELNDRGRAVNAPQIPLDLENGKTVDPVFLVGLVASIVTVKEESADIRRPTTLYWVLSTRFSSISAMLLVTACRISCRLL